MAQHFSLRQRNNLLIGNLLKAELSAPRPDMRRFIEIQGYLPSLDQKRRVASKILNAANQDELRFLLNYYDVVAEYVDSWDADLYTTTLMKRRDIESIEQLEQVLLEIMADLGAFKPIG